MKKVKSDTEGVSVGISVLLLHGFLDSNIYCSGSHARKREREREGGGERERERERGERERERGREKEGERERERERENIIYPKCYSTSRIPNGLK